MTQVPCTFCDEPPAQKIGNAGDTVDVYALRGGTFVDSVFQLGVAHAHIVTDQLPKPSVLVGVSLGAVHAAAIAEILQAPSQLPDAERSDPANRRGASLNRFREILFAYQDFAMEMPGALPDAFEADAGRPLRPNPQAIHFETERQSRQEALRARSGLIALFNDLFRQRITIRTITRLLRAWLGRKAAGELPGWRKYFFHTRESWRLATAVIKAPRQCAQFFMSFIHVWVGGTARVVRAALQRWRPSILQRTLNAVFRVLEGRHGEGYTAGDIIFRARRPRIAPRLFLVVCIAVLAAIGLAWAAWAEPGFFFFCVVPAAAALIACALYDVWDDLPGLRDAWRTNWVEKVLAYYDLRSDLGNDYLVEDLFIRLFDPTYHGDIDMAGVADRAMRAREEVHPKTKDHAPRKFESFATSKWAPVRVSTFVADLASGEMKENKAEDSVVEGLRAAVATLPFLRPVSDKAAREFYVNGSNVASDATSPAIDVLRLHLHPEVAQVRLFSVVPVTLRDQRKERESTMGTIEVALAGLELSAFRDSHVDHEIVQFYNRLLPETSRAPERLPPKTSRALACFGSEKQTLPNGDTVNICRHFVRSELVPIEPLQALHTTGRFLEARTKTDRQKVIARAVAEGCRATLAARLGKSEFGCRAMITGGQAPGAIEVCAHCDAFEPDTPPPAAPAAAAADATTTTPVAPVAPVAVEQSHAPTVNLLFSGGVFRGVFQIGVLNALNEMGVKPNIIAGSSVGSIVAAMIAHVFRADESEKQHEIARLASTFMTLDHLIITDRFADFLRRFTLRAAAARFSLRDADAFFRNYDSSMTKFGSVARRVVGGIEHLFYVSPFKLSALVHAFRQQNYSKAKKLVGEYAQEICDRSLVGAEVLGAEPLALLIKQHVLSADCRQRHSHAIPLSLIGGDELTFLATATNLTERKLEIFSSGETGLKRATLIEALLASSAFPGVFRPRWSREILFHDNTRAQYIDGGVLDNLPMSAVVNHMYEAAVAGKIPFRAEHNLPHLVLTASLEPEADRIDREEAARLARSWPAALDRAKRLKYNQKIDRFAKAQRDLRYIWQRYASARHARPIGANTLDIEVLVVKPKWLCETFAFHPMLGFRRKTQAASIAHGCAVTLSTFARVRKGMDDYDPHWLDAWASPEKTGELLADDAVALNPVMRGAGKCHFRRDTPCPFAYETLKEIPDTIMRDAVKREVAAIHRACGNPETHTARYPETAR